MQNTLTSYRYPISVPSKIMKWDMCIRLRAADGHVRDCGSTGLLVWLESPEDLRSPIGL